MNSHEVFIHIHQGCFAGTGAIVRLPQCQWSKPDGYGKISQCITTTKHSKAKTACILLGIYCRNWCYKFYYNYQQWNTIFHCILVFFYRVYSHKSFSRHYRNKITPIGAATQLEKCRQQFHDTFSKWSFMSYFLENHGKIDCDTHMYSRVTHVYVSANEPIIGSDICYSNVDHDLCRHMASLDHRWINVETCK